MFKAIVLSSIVLNVGLLLGRVSGFVRQSFIAAAFGDSKEADVAIFMLTVPDVLVNFLMGGALGAVLIPLFAKNAEQAKQIAFQALLLVGVLSTVLSLLFLWKSSLIASIFAPGFSGEQIQQAATAFRYVVALVPLTMLAGVTTAFLHYKNKFTLPSLGTLIINSSIIIGLYLVYIGKGELKLLALFVLVGGFARLISQWFVAKPKVSVFPWHIGRSFVKQYGRAMVTGSILVFFPVIAKAVASLYGEGSYATMDYALKLVQFPLVISVTFVATVFFPRLAASSAVDRTQFRRLCNSGIQATIVLACIATGTLYFVSDTYSSYVYQHGSMGAGSTAIIGTITSVGLLSLPLQGVAGFVTATLFAERDTKTPLAINLFGLLFFVLVGYYEIFGEGLTGLMYALTISFGCISLIGLFILQRKGLQVLQSISQIAFLVPLIIAIFVLVSGGMYIQTESLGQTPTFLLTIGLGCVALLLFVALNPSSRKFLQDVMPFKP